VSFRDSLQQASFGGVPFGVLSADIMAGRRQELHEYPYRDRPWVEDLGRAARKIGFTAYLVEDAKSYGGGDVIAQREKLIAACESPTAATLVHPTFGRMLVTVDEQVEIEERWDEGRYFAVRLAFIESGQRSFPSDSGATSNATKDAADKFDLKTISTYVTKAKIAIARGAAVIRSVESTVADWTGQITGLVKDATGLLNMAVDLPGDLGRYFGGRTAGFTGSTRSLTSGLTLSDLVAVGIANRATVSAQLTAANAAAAAGNPGAIAATAQSALAALVAAAADPLDGVRLILTVVEFQALPVVGTSPIAAAMSAATVSSASLFRRLSLAALARIVADYQPASADDAARLRDRVTALLDAEILVAGDAGDDDDYVALRAMRSTIVADLNARGAALPPLRTFAIGSALPSLVLANRLYRNSDRADDLIVQVDPVHPAFFPVTFTALAA
jgi:prophage DNA circulation protein